ncbi:basic leucine zipper 19-like [Dioscorea cayenensis subsp. rotundata]|uniref:Basic leucine zipper 19-like n=1 Tax=Dioscorea cayennensis subsp. rotundata TaxID=55577 RepID=A0AB40BGE0_DIOCR|nr:basic leucine zipper 19-like [Dioscorea cayenensis subsp. rotundata]
MEQYLLPPKIPSMATTNYSFDDFLDFSSAKRSSHRRSSSDSIAFLDPDDDFDADQLLSLLDNDAPPPSVSSPSDDEKLLLPAMEDSSITLVPAGCKVEDKISSPLDPKRVKRILANRQSAQRSRVRKLQYISELERSVTTLQTEVSALSPRVAFLDHQRSALTAGNSHLRQRIAALTQDKIFKDAHQEALKKELERLRNIYNQQSTENMVE